jgi:hypothetical protein
MTFNEINGSIVEALVVNSVKINPFTQFTYSLPTQFLSHFDIFFFFWTALKTDSTFFNRRWLALTGLNQKFQSFFLTNSTQQRVYSN